MVDSSQDNPETITKTVQVIKKMTSLLPGAKPAHKIIHHEKKHKVIHHHKAHKIRPHHQSKKVKHHVTPHKAVHHAEPKYNDESGPVAVSRDKNHHIKQNTMRTPKDMALDFAEKVHKQFNLIIKASILFGSQATNSAEASSDIDVILIIDDASVNWDLELITWYREELGRIIGAQDYYDQLHVNTIKLTTWWQDLMHGDPIVLNILRYGEALIDSGGFFNPLKALLAQGRISSTPEAVYSALQRSPSHLARSKIAILNSIEGVYWTMVDAAQAALITAGKLPPSPDHLPQMLKETFVDNGLIKVERVRQLRDIYTLHKGITHREINEVKGEEIDRWQGIAESFMLEMTRLIDRILEAQKNKKE